MMHDVLLVLPPMIAKPYWHLSPEEMKKKNFTNYAERTRLTRVPQGLLSLATHLNDSEGLDVVIYDPRLDLWRGEEFWLGKVTQLANNSKLVGFSMMTDAIPVILKMIKYIKLTGNGVPIVVGGIHPTLYPVQTAQNMFIDFAIPGDSEEPLLELCRQLGKSVPDFSKVPSLHYKKGEAVKSNPVCKPFDIASMGFPHYQALLNLEGYLTRARFRGNVLQRGVDYNTSRGCPFACSFCINTVHPQNRLWRSKPAEKVIDELKQLKEKFNLSYIWLEEENPFTNIKRSEKIAQTIIDEHLDIEWYANIRAETAFNTPMQTLQLLRKSGWCEGAVGVESGSDPVLQYLNKGTTAAKTRAAMKRLSDLDVYVLVSTMMFMPYPHETYADRVKTWELLRELHRDKHFSVMTGPYRPYPCNPLYDDAVAAGFKEPTSLEGWEGVVCAYNNPKDAPWVKDYKRFGDEYQKFKYWGTLTSSKRLALKILNKIRAN